MAESVRTVNVIYGWHDDRLSAKVTERFITLHAAESGVTVPASPVARYWCKRVPKGTDAPKKYMIGFTVPVAASGGDLPSDTHNLSVLDH